MNPWAVFIVAVSQVVVLYWAFAARHIRLIDASLLSKNRPWVDDHPAIRARYAGRRYSVAGFHAAGAAWLAAIVYMWTTSGVNAMIAVSVAAALAWVAMVLGYAGVGYQRTWKAIPLPARRSVALERRALRDFVPPALTFGCYGLYALAIGVYVAAIARGQLPLQVFVGRMIGVAIVLVVGTMTLLYCVWRKRQPIDDAWPAYRKLEVRGNVALLYLLFPILAWRIGQDLFGVSLLDEASVMSAISAAMQLAWFAFMRSAAVRRVLAS